MLIARMSPLRCGAFTDNQSAVDYHYCDSCLDRFAELEASGVLVESDRDGKCHREKYNRR
jgi:hypothetical protein